MCFCTNIYKENAVYYMVLLFLPPANEVWGKVMFLHLSVILFTGECCVFQHATGGGGVVSASGPGGVHPQGHTHTPGQTPPWTYTHTHPGPPPPRDGH